MLFNGRYIAVLKYLTLLTLIMQEQMNILITLLLADCSQALKYMDNPGQPGHPQTRSAPLEEHILNGEIWTFKSFRPLLTLIMQEQISILITLLPADSFQALKYMHNHPSWPANSNQISPFEGTHLNP